MKIIIALLCGAGAWGAAIDSHTEVLNAPTVLRPFCLQDYSNALNACEDWKKEVQSISANKVLKAECSTKIYAKINVNDRCRGFGEHIGGIVQFLP